MTTKESEALKGIIPMMRRGVSKALAKQPRTGIEVPGVAGGRITDWWHKAPAQGKAPVLFELHGGGFALGDARKGDALRTWMAHRWGVHVVGVGYRLAPEDPWPAALDDVVDTMRHFAQHADEYGMDPERFHLIGYSAGANLALAACLKLQQQEDPGFAVKAVALHYPFLDAATDPSTLPSRSEDLPVEMMEAFNSWYATDNDPRNPLISPLFATDDQLARLPFVTQYPAVGDALFGSSQRFDERLKAAGARCAFHPVEGVYHGYAEDAGNLGVYRATSLPETVAARPDGFAQVAADAFAASLDEILGAPLHDVPFNPETAIEDAQRYAAQAKEAADVPVE